ncbi:hypothetical protein [Polyangium sp. 6x1]|uniref:hypothetical protein n=1 Tax=Polyangium sp. 6x1 TaxID=3042689 RepID=UPI002482C9F0|nr:hypothetical protein [Polyangium sp. 6x1]MDI1451087.1 hypothetical protein [Polyangium sp. 6x1]
MERDEQQSERHLVVDVSERQPVFLLIGRNDAHIRLSPSAYHLLRMVEKGVSFERIAAHLGRQGDNAITAADVEAGYRRVIGRIEAIEARGDGLSGAFWFRRRLLPAPVVARIATRCAAAFHPAAVVVFGALIAAGSVLAYEHGQAAHGGGFWTGFALFLISLVAHEIGHASACARHGARPSEIGFLFYLIYPAFYSNVSAAWTLGRRQRVIVDLGGVYFQAIVGAVYAFALALTGWAPLRIALLLIAGSVVLTLNPILKFDGYWVVADALGVTNLGQQPRRIVRHAIRCLCGRASPPLPWPPVVLVVLALYTAVALGFWVWFLVELGPRIVHHALALAETIMATVRQLREAPLRFDPHALLPALASLYALLFPLLLSWRLLRAAYVRIGRWAVGKKNDRPA